jgi:hypothetical protein
MATGAKRRIGVPGEPRSLGWLWSYPLFFGSRNKRWLVHPNIHNYDVCWGPRLDFARHDSLIFRERLGISYGTVRMRFQKVS